VFVIIVVCLVMLPCSLVNDSDKYTASIFTAGDHKVFEWIYGYHLQDRRWSQ